MKSFVKGTALSAMAGVAMAGSADAAEILVTSDIATSTTWTADNTYDLQGQIYVLPGASLTIEAGTVVASTTGAGGSLAVCKGAQIFVKGTRDEPVIMTSKADVATWAADAGHPTGGDPKTGSWRPSANEWGNLTVMGGAYISENVAPSGQSNTPVPNAGNTADMEGLTPTVGQETLVQYGGGDDDDDSGCINFLSLRYGGKVAALNKELNGLSLGGIGRETDVHHVDIMNNVDDGIEIWGGTVNLKYVNLWNIGDDTLDIDQGYRGKIQFGLIVQGYSLVANQGSGAGDNAIETDGAEDSDWQPVTTTEIRNLTVVGQPLGGDHGTAWRDNARVRYENCIWMDLGEDLVKNDGDDGDGASGYGHNGTLSFADTWATAYTVTSTVNAPANPGAFYTAQTQGNLADIESSVFFRNLKGGGIGSGYGDAAYATAVSVGVDVGNDNLLTLGFDDADAPIKTIVRGPAVAMPNTGDMLPVIFINPCPANDALVAGDSYGITDEFFTTAPFRGGFAPDDNWLTGWTAADAFGYVDNSREGSWNDKGASLAAENGNVNAFPVLEAHGASDAGTVVQLTLRNVTPGSTVGLFYSVGLPNSRLSLPFKGGELLLHNPFFGPIVLPGAFLPAGKIELPLGWPAPGATGLEVNFQYVCQDAAGPNGFTLSNALSTID